MARYYELHVLVRVSQPLNRSATTQSRPQLYSLSRDQNNNNNNNTKFI